MSKIYIYLACYLLGVVSALLLVWFTKKPTIEQHVNKIKQKGGPGNTMDTQIEFKNEKTEAELRKGKRIERKNKRNEKRLIKTIGT